MGAEMCDRIVWLRAERRRVIACAVREDGDEEECGEKERQHCLRCGIICEGRC